MCPNESCARYRERTRLMGGCDCGTHLVPFAAPEPTNDQIESCMVALGLPVVPGAMDRSAEWREAGLRFHKLLTDTLNGDDDAARRLDFLVQRFSRTLA